MIKENKYLTIGLGLLGLFILAVIFDPFRNLPVPLKFVLYLILVLPGIFFTNAAKHRFVKMAEEMHQPKDTTDTAADRNGRIMAIAVGVIGAGLAFGGRMIIMHNNRVLYSVLGWVTFVIGMMLVGAALVLRKVAGI